jgi:DNA polymerase III delta prime subunit
MTHTLWTEKYRPDTLTGYIGNESLKAKIARMIASGDIPHLLLSGTPGTGKTTVAKMLVKNIECDYLYINASDENNVETIRTKVKSFASTIGFKPMKIIILDEADYITQNAQAALRNIMETFSRSTRFILTCNYVERIIDPIVSRTQQFHVVPPTKLEVAKHLVTILKQEDVSYEVSDVKLLVDVLKLDVDEVVAGDIKLRVLELLSQKGDVKKRFQEIRQLIADAGIRDFAGLYELLYSRVDEYAAGHVSQVILHIAEGQKFDGQVVNKEINMMATIINILQTIG